ncbi:MAG: dihydrolipoamide acetyltransferase family protein [Polyangiales bacterium]
MPEFVMPSLGADMDAGTLVEWKKPLGAFVKRGEILAEVETDKGVISVEAFHEGVVERYLVEPGTRVPVGTPLAMIGEGPARSPGVVLPPPPEPAVAIAASAVLLPPPPSSAPPTVAQISDSLVEGSKGMTISARHLATELSVDPAGVIGTGKHGTITRSDVAAKATAGGAAKGGSTAPPPRPPAEGRVRVTPFALRRAAELGVPIGACRPSGPDGAVVAADVERAAQVLSAAAARAPKPDTTANLTPEQRMRRAIGAAMSRSKRDIPHYYVTHTLDLAPALEALAAHNAAVPMSERVLPAVLLLRAAALALKKVPELNAKWTGEEAPPIAEVHLGVAIALRKGGLVAPPIPNADRLSMPEIMAKLDDLVMRSRSGGLTATELAGGTITVTSLGDRGVESLLPIIYPPQVAIVGFGKILTRPWVVGDAVVPRPVVTATLAADHRVSDGHRGGLYLAEIESLLSNPERLFNDARGKAP